MVICLLTMRPNWANQYLLVLILFDPEILPQGLTFMVLFHGSHSA